MNIFEEEKANEATLKDARVPILHSAKIEEVIKILPKYCINDLVKLQDVIDEEIVNRGSFGLND